MTFAPSLITGHDPDIYQTEDEMFDEAMEQEFLAVSTIARCGTLGSMNDIGFGYGDPWKRDPIPYLIHDTTRAASRKRKRKSRTRAKLHMEPVATKASIKARADKISKIMLRMTLDWAFETTGLSNSHD